MWVLNFILAGIGIVGLAFCPDVVVTKEWVLVCAAVNVVLGWAGKAYEDWGD